MHKQISLRRDGNFRSDSSAIDRGQGRVAQTPYVPFACARRIDDPPGHYFADEERLYGAANFLASRVKGLTHDARDRVVKDDPRHKWQN
jgi:hypothetical protein